MTIEEKLKQLRTNAGFTQNNVADALGIERSTYAYYELGKNQIPLKHLYSLSYVYDVSIKWFLDETDGFLKLHDDSCFQKEPNPDEPEEEDEESLIGNIQLSTSERIFLARIRIIVGRNRGHELIEYVDKLMREE